MRLFVAADLPECAKEAIAELRFELPAARWVPVEQLHLTLRFIGEVDPATFQLIRKALAAVPVEGFSLTLRGVGHFPPGKHPRVLWVGMDPSPPLIRMQQHIEGTMRELGIPGEERRFSPHITLARLQDAPVSAVNAFEARHQAFACPPFEVREFHLYSSVLSGKGATHRREATYHHKGA
ncbi:RNA 2',3'-cyclic phosphodiesterase [Geomonas sp. RF6]|uniref:RNA 2',3'-cyclic phosphodiesterase n=1 Tax=Geomonas sp. RF6 TaxID=2897342 RepID=UPI001E3FF75A|nr:RNA 2',3'-cyclic phosphodiesterase [Geomonas sp. RF6]UFS72111.1 RNA 2',3'-cyclic phosphodiesterase [Geomonas sp. RF6]